MSRQLCVSSCVYMPVLVTPRACREEVMKFVKSLYGFGDYAASNVAMLLGFYAEVPLDSETVRGHANTWDR